jgi:hypothetical protein
MNSFYCPFCKADIEAVNEEEVLLGEHDGYLFVHKDTSHLDDFEPMEYLTQH